MEVDLPEHASEASRRRSELAYELAQSCPPTLGDEIALVGSTAHGFADDESDLELNLWSNAIPPRDERVGWLAAAGATEIHVEETPRPDNSYWIGFCLGDVPAEVGWQTFRALRTNLDRIRSGAVIDRKTLAFGDVIVSAIPLRTKGLLPKWQAALNEYSDDLQRSLINAALERWSEPNHVAKARRLAQRGERLALMESLLADLEAALRVLYAANRRWEPSRKWTLTLAQEFAPDDLIPRIDAILSDKSLEQRVECCAHLCLEVLELVPEGYDISGALSALQTGLA